MRELAIAEAMMASVQIQLAVPERLNQSPR